MICDELRRDAHTAALTLACDLQQLFRIRPVLPLSEAGAQLVGYLKVSRQAEGQSGRDDD